MIVDSSALMAILAEEPGAAALARRLLAEPSRRMSAGTLVETLIVAEAGGVVDDLTALLEEVGIEIIPVDAAQAALALDGFRRFGKGRHPAGLNYGDLFAYALARAEDEPLLFVGNDFARTDLRVA